MKVALAMLASVGLITTVGTSANAAPGTMTYTEFLNSTGYQLLSAENTATANYLSTVNNVRILNTTVGMIGNTEASRIEIELLSTKTSSKVSLKMVTAGVETAQPGFTFANGYAYVPSDTALVRPELKNGAAALARLAKSQASDVRMTQAEAGADFTQYTPDAILGGGAIDPLGKVTDNAGASDLATLQGLTFSEVTTSPNATEPTWTDYEFTATLDNGGLLPATDMVIVSTYDQNHVFQKQKLSMNVLGMVLESTTTIEILDQLTIAPVPAANYVDWSSLVAMGKRISAEKSLASKAKALSSKAAALAKSSKKTLSATQLAAAAKALKYSVTTVKNGVKLTAKYQGQAGSVCVTAVKGKPVTGNC